MLVTLVYSPAAVTGAAVQAPTDDGAESLPGDSAEAPGHTHSAEELAEAEEEFTSIDADGDGFITEEEILSMDDTPEVDEISEFFDTYDLDEDGKVSFDEILSVDTGFLGADEMHDEA